MKPNCLQCRNLKYSKGKVWCAVGHLAPKSETLPVKTSVRLMAAAKGCKDFESMVDE